MSDIENEDETLELDPTSPEAQLEQLKARAKMMGVPYGPNIKLETLQKKIAAALSDTPAEVDEDEPEDEGEAAVVGAATAAAVVDPMANMTPIQREMHERNLVRMEALKLVRIRISCLDPAKKDLQGDFFSVGNDLIGAIKRFIPFNAESEEGTHVEEILFQFLKAKRFNQTRTVKRDGKELIINKMVPEFAIEVLPQLTPLELERLRLAQAAAAGQVTA